MDYLCMVVAISTLAVSPNQESILSPYIEATGTVAQFTRFAGEHEGEGGIDFSFQFTAEGQQDPWLVVSRGSTPFMQYRLGPTYLGIERNHLTDGTRVRLLGIKGVDRVPQSFHNRELPAGKTVTALILATGDKPLQENKDLLYVNNWFHPWRDGLHGILDKEIARYYVDRTDPFWVCGWLPLATAASGTASMFGPARDLLSEKDFAVVSKPPFEKVLFRGYLVSASNSPLGYRLKASQIWKRNAGTGGYDLILGDDRDVEVRKP